MFLVEKNSERGPSQTKTEFLKTQVVLLGAFFGDTRWSASNHGKDGPKKGGFFHLQKGLLQPQLVGRIFNHPINSIHQPNITP